MNELQQKEFEILKIFINICEKLDLKYYLVCGSALGAVKYQGFIPWDDDVDVGLFREDYEKFLQEAPRYLPEDIFLQTYVTDPHYPNIFAKLRNSKTTYIEKSVANILMNHGVYIDVFPLDGYPLGENEQDKLEKKKKLYKRIISCVYDVERSLKGQVAVKIMRFMGLHKKTSRYLKKYEKLISAYPIADSHLVCNHGNWQGKLEYASKEQYGDGAMILFEGMKVRVPQKYDKYLTQKYGKWRADLPEEKKKGHHYYTVCDLKKAYTEYVK